MAHRFCDEAVAALVARGAAPGRTLAPPELQLRGALAYGSVTAAGLESVDWVVIHKGRLEELGRELLDAALAVRQPVFANEVFVVLGRTGELAADHLHVHPLHVGVARLPRPGPVAPPARQAVYLGDHRLLTRTVHGHKLFVDGRDVNLTPHLLLDGDWEGWITRVVRSVVRPGMRAADVGANVGWYTLLLAEGVGAEGHVHAFEPVPDVHELLFRNAEVNGLSPRVTCHRAAVGARRGRARLHVRQKHKASSSLFSQEEGVATFLDSTVPLEVDVVALDEVLAADPRLDLLKVDAEGAEPLVLEGSRRLLAANPGIHVFLEFAPVLIAGASVAPADLLRDLRAQGFVLRRIDPHRGVVPTGEAELLDSAMSELYLTRS